MKFKKRSLAKTFKNTSFWPFALQPSMGKIYCVFRAGKRNFQTGRANFLP